MDSIIALAQINSIRKKRTVDVLKIRKIIKGIFFFVILIYN